MNIGGAIGPMLAMPVRENLGIAYVLVVLVADDALLCCRDAAVLPRAGTARRTRRRPKSMAQVLADMGKVFRNVRFMMFLVIFSGFWVMFWHIFYALPFYVRDVLKFERFELIETVDAWTIILVTMPAAALAKRLQPIAAMTLGFALATASWFLMGAVPDAVDDHRRHRDLRRSARRFRRRATTSTSPTSRRRSRSAPTWASRSCRSPSARSSAATRRAGSSSTYVNRSATPWHMWYYVGAIGVVVDDPDGALRSVRGAAAGGASRADST